MNDQRGAGSRFPSQVLGAMAEIVKVSVGGSLFGGALPVGALSGIIGNVASDVVARLLGTPRDTQDFKVRAEAAAEHLNNAAAILGQLQLELGERTQELQAVVAEVESGKDQAQHWRTLASVDKQVAQSLVREVEVRVRTQIQAELDRNKTVRRIAGFLVWTITLVLGALVGLWAQELWQRGYFHWF